MIFVRSKRFREEQLAKEEAMKNHLMRRFNQPSNILMPGTIAPLYAQQDCVELMTLEKMTGVEKLRRRQARKSRYKIFQIKTFNLLERPSNSGALFYHGMVFVLILASLFLSVLITIPKYETDKTIQSAVYYLEVSLVIIFSIEYILRIWSCSCHGNYAGFWGKLRFIKKPYQVIDIIVIVATTVVVMTSEHGQANLLSVSMFRFLRFLQVLRILRLDRQRGAFKIVSHVIYEHRQELLTCWYMSFILLVACTFLVYLAEKSDDKNGNPSDSGELDNLGDGLYWGVITLSTVGYGDFSPKNWVAKVIVCIFAFIGTAFFALPAGILGSGFALQVAQNQKQKHFNRRRVPAALVIQYAWRAYAAHPSRKSDVTWVPHQSVVTHHTKEKKFSYYYGKPKNSPSQTPTTGRRSVVMNFKRKLNASRINSYVDGDTLQSRRSSIGATIPTALDIRDRCQSEGNLLLVSPNNVEDHQATIVSLPPQHYDDYQDTLMNGGHDPRFHGQPAHFASTMDVQLQPLMEKDKNCIRFIRKTKLFIYIRKFKEECRPYDVKDVIEQYTSGQMDMFSFIKRFQSRMETAIGIKEDQEEDNGLNVRITRVEEKVNVMDEKLDTILELLQNRKHNLKCQHNSHGGGTGDDMRRFSNGTGSTEIDVPMSDSDESNDGFHHQDPIDGSKRAERKRGATLESLELTKRLEKLKDEEETRDALSNERRARAESRFTVTPSFLPEDKETEIQPEAVVPEENINLPGSSNKSSIEKLSPPSCPISLQKKYQSVPNIPKHTNLKDPNDEPRRSSSVHFDESSLVKHRSQSDVVSIYDDIKQPNNRLHPSHSSRISRLTRSSDDVRGNAYVSDLESDESSKSSTPKEHSSPRSSRTTIMEEDEKEGRGAHPNKITDKVTVDTPLKSTHASNLTRTASEPLFIKHEENVELETIQNGYAQGASKSAFELNC
uniref:Uncharacterized protein n=1 Tax=Clytia hemisphaerica TaxID=252671 RepID=A0A7M5V6A6_9CNID